MVDDEALFLRLSAIVSTLAAVRSLDGLASSIHQIVEDVVRVERSGVYLCEFETGRLCLFRAKGFNDDEKREAERTAWERHPGRVMREQVVLHVPDIAMDAAQTTANSARSFVVRSRLWLPIVSEGGSVGAIGLASGESHSFSTVDMAVLRFAAGTTGLMYKNLRDTQALATQLSVASEQRRELAALSSPLVEVADGVVVLPIIGLIDEERAHLITEKLLAAVVAKQIRSVILDMTGVESIEQASIDHIGRMRSAVQLLGSRCVFSGISPETAAMAVQMNIALDGWTSFSTVRQALAKIQAAARQG